MSDRILTMIRRIIRAELPNYTFMGTYEYAVQSISGQIISADPTDTTIGLPHIDGILIRSSVLGETVKPAIGTTCLVQFINGNSKRPIVVGFEPTVETISIDASQKISITAPQVAITDPGGLPAARATDPVLVMGVFGGNIVSGSNRTTIG